MNNPELSDIQFMIEGHIFYAHKIILVNASNRFRAMLSNKFAESSQPVIEINDVRYHIFQVSLHKINVYIMMQLIVLYFIAGVCFTLVISIQTFCK